MAWELAHPNDLPEIAERLVVDEWLHVAFTSRIAEKRRPVFPNPRTVSIYVNRCEENSIREAVLFNRGGLVLPVLADGTNDSPRYDVSTLLHNDSRPLHSIMGETSRVSRIEQAIQRSLRARIDYHLMVFDLNELKKLEELCPRSTLENVSIYRAKSRDSVTLFPLQREYEKEEVLLDPNLYNASATYINLQRNLKNEIVYYAQMDKRIVAKAGTNAQGLAFDQLGGVYTVPEYRSKGIATIVLCSLIQHLSKHNRGICLFVKQDNPAALRLYTKLGFVRRGGFRITYFRS